MTTTAEGVTMIRTEEWNRGQCDHNLNFMGKEFSKNLETLIWKCNTVRTNLRPYKHIYLTVTIREDHVFQNSVIKLCKFYVIYEGWNFNSGNYLFTTDTK